MRQVSDTLAGTAERVAVEAELKVVLGFRMVKGHRAWRRLRVRGWGARGARGLGLPDA
jgi:hypothetical protein